MVYVHWSQLFISYSFVHVIKQTIWYLIVHPNAHWPYAYLTPIPIPMPQVRLSLLIANVTWLWICSPIEISSPHVDAVFSNCHAQIFHSQHCSAVAVTLATSTESRTWSSETSTFALLGLLSCRLFSGSLSWTASYGCPTRASWYGGTGRCIGGSDSRVLVSVGSNVGDEFLSCQGEKTRKR
jgi:hypothetical protein